MVSEQVVLRSNKRLKFAPFHSAGRSLRSRRLAGRYAKESKQMNQLHEIYGRCLIEANKLERTLQFFLILKEIQQTKPIETRKIFDKYKKKTLGQTISLIKTRRLLPQNFVEELEKAKTVRNMLTHNIVNQLGFRLYKQDEVPEIYNELNLVIAFLESLTTWLNELLEAMNYVSKEHNELFRKFFLLTDHFQHFEGIKKAGITAGLT